MTNSLHIYNTLSRKKEPFSPVHPPFVGMYVCGPTVYGDPHLGHARPAITFDIVFRYLKYLGYKVRYVRNITDVGHLERDADEGEDKVAKKARLEELEPMEVVQHYMNEYRNKMALLNVLPPSIEPIASGHIIEQQELVERILQAGFAYESNGSVYFDVDKYNQSHHYGKLSGRKIEDLLSQTRQLGGQTDKHNPLDFAIWKKAEPEHIMRWPSKWSEGFPGWHIECSAMSRKYLGEQIDIHGGGMDLLFPHHECEIAQTVAAQGKESVRCWMHNNLITLNGQKMGKSLGNAITLDEFFSGENTLLDKAYSPATIRFFMLQAHYRSTLDFSNEALKATEKGYDRLMEGIATIEKIKPSSESTIDPQSILDKVLEAMNDDLNTPVAISALFDGIKDINSVFVGQAMATEENISSLRKIYHTVAFEILGIIPGKVSSVDEGLTSELIRLLLELRIEARKNKDFKMADKIRDDLLKMGVEVRDTAEGFEFRII